MKKYQDHYVEEFNNGATLLQETAEREANTERREFASKDITIWAGIVSDTGDTINMRRLGNNPAGEEVILRKNTKAQHTSEAAIHTATREVGVGGGSLLFLGYQTKARLEFIPISADAKLSIMNRGKFSISGELDEVDFDINPIALACLIEDSIKKYTSSIQCCIVYGKIIGMMSKRFCPIPQNELVDTVSRILAKRYPNSEVIGGVISNRVSSVDFNLHEVVTENGNVSPADECGIVQGDIITQVNDEIVTSVSDFTNRVIASDGENISITVKRNEKYHSPSCQ